MAGIDGVEMDDDLDFAKDAYQDKLNHTGNADRCSVDEERMNENSRKQAAAPNVQRLRQSGRIRFQPDRFAEVDNDGMAQIARKEAPGAENEAGKDEYARIDEL